MKYAVKEISEISKGTWKCVLEYWNGCRCGSKIKQVTINQERKPTKKEIIGEFLNSKA